MISWRLPSSGGGSRLAIVLRSGVDIVLSSGRNGAMPSTQNTRPAFTDIADARQPMAYSEPHPASGSASSRTREGAVGKTEERIAEFIVSTRAEEIPAASYDAARRSCFDCVGVMLAGAAQPPGRIITDFVADEGARGECTVVGSAIKTSRTMAALANGTLGHALDFDDMGGFGHPTVALLLPALAVGEPLGVSGRDLLAAYVIGLEVGVHLQAGAHYAQGERGFHATAVFGTMAATATACRLLGLSRQETVTALGIAGSTPSGIVQNFGTYTKPLHAGLASRSGVMAALLAARGWTACDNVIESRVGWGTAYIGEGNYHPEAMARDLGTVWKGKEVVVIKKYPCCGTTHSSLDSLLSLMSEHGFTLDDVAEVEITGLPAISHVLLYLEPRRAYQGKFSIHYTTATALVDGQIGIPSFEDDRLARPEFAEALGKVEVKVISKWDPAYGEAPAMTPVTVRLKDGRTLTRATNRKTMRGSASDPLSADDLQAKFRRNARLHLPEPQVEEALQRWWRLDELSDVREALATVAAGRAVSPPLPAWPPRMLNCGALPRELEGGADCAVDGATTLRRPSRT